MPDRAGPALAGVVALAALGCASTGDPDHPARIHEHLDRVERRLPSLDAAPPEALGDALARLDGLAGRHPTGFRLRLLRARVLLARGDPRRALADLEHLHALYGADPEGSALAGRALLALGRRREARAKLREALDLDPRHPGALCATGLLLAESGAADAAARYFERVLAIVPDHAEARRCLDATGTLAAPATAAGLADVDARRQAGLLLVAAGRWREGTAALLAVLRERPDDVPALVGAAKGFARRGLDRHARPLLARAAVLRPDHADIAFQLGMVCARLGAADPARHAEAARAFAVAAKGMPGDPRAHHAAAKSCAAIGSLAQAETHYAAAAALGTPSADLACDWGLHRARQGDWAAAVEIYRAGLAAHAGDPRLEANLMLALFRAGYEREPQAISDRLAARADLDPAVRALVDACRGSRG